ncbi:MULTISPECIES: MFS transporter [unclassified Paracoccus (in: a-proteobacteria)]|uniref:MFS transporter n=1 Tax=unclassified Paracoccus (in: a-proteobacteria) TaxID=2688777 RepID=UPI0012B2625F|nr:MULTISPECIES: MFS transporter [unclassified Paracoccus (in: a-proteobacteria)]UXU74274.1 MFS transporter [Paracoccus sp. SMMA_5]UXU80165.1 MFS transporter [Paracoccus sp. SMMA_5_TC]
MTPDDQMRRARRNVIVLMLAQAILGAQMSMIFIVGGLAGQMLSPNPCIATLPLSMMILGSALSARPLSGFMQRHGRRAGFLLACGAAGLGAALAAYGLASGNFWLFTMSALLTGVYMAAQGFFRFAATDCAPPEYQPRAISYVLAGGLLAAFTGPALVRMTAEMTAVPFMATYAAIIGLNLLGPVLFAFLDIPRPAVRDGSAHGGRPTAQLLRQPAIAVAIICGMVSYALMNLVMTSAPLAVVGCGFHTSDAANIVAGHVLAMFAPSFFTGHLIARFGATRIVMLGLVILAAAGAVALSGVDLAQFYIALILLGLGWNFGYIGATAMLTRTYRPEERERVQGINDAIVFGGVFLASLSSGGLMNCMGGSAQAGWSAVNLAMLPFLVLAGGALLWLMLRPRETAQ